MTSDGVRMTWMCGAVVVAASAPFGWTVDPDSRPEHTLWEAPWPLAAIVGTSLALLLAGVCWSAARAPLAPLLAGFAVALLGVALRAAAEGDEVLVAAPTMCGAAVLVAAAVSGEGALRGFTPAGSILATCAALLILVVAQAGVEGFEGTDDSAFSDPVFGGPGPWACAASLAAAVASGVLLAVRTADVRAWPHADRAVAILMLSPLPASLLDPGSYGFSVLILVVVIPVAAMMSWQLQAPRDHSPIE